VAPNNIPKSGFHQAQQAGLNPFLSLFFDNLNETGDLLFNIL